MKMGTDTPEKEVKQRSGSIIPILAVLGFFLALIGAFLHGSAYSDLAVRLMIGGVGILVGSGLIAAILDRRAQHD